MCSARLWEAARDTKDELVMRIVVRQIAALFAGALGGAAVGLAEAALVTWVSSASTEYWLFLFAVLAYAVVGAGIGLAAGLVWEAVRRGQADAGEVARFGMAAAVALPVFAVGRYHVVQRVFHEDLVLASAAGIVSHALLLIGAIAAAVACAWLFRRWYGLAGTAGTVGALVLFIGLAWAVGFVTRPVSQPIVRRPVSAAAAGKPNVILIVVDTLRADAIEPYGAPAGSTPAFAKLASDSVVFERAYAQSSWTRPSIASILTSEYPSVHGAMLKMDFLPDRALTVAEALRAEGYWTAGFVNNINVAPVFNFQQGFDEFVYLEPEFYFWATESATKLAMYKTLRVARERFFSNRMYYPNYYQAAAVVNQHVLAWLAEKPPEPFFLLMHYMDPHDPYFEHPYNGHGVARVMTPSPAPERVEDLRNLYAGEVRYLDAELDLLVRGMRDRGVYDRSIVALTADHGEEFLEHGGWWHGTTLYEEAVHVPLFIKRPGEPQRGQHRSDLVRTIDIVPTLLSAAVVRVPPSFLGQDLFVGPVTGPLLAEEDLEGNQLASIRTGPWKLITANPGNPRGLSPVELYNVEVDARERHNLASDESGRVAQMLGELQRLRAELGKASARTRTGG